MAREADFSSAVARALAERTGFICSFPGCNAPTIGPSAETATSTSKTGMACHIYAASDGPAARRVNPKKSIDELRSISNGIWMCYRHGKLIDGDACTYTPELLADWRRLAERRADLQHQFGRAVNAGDLKAEPFAKMTVELRVPEITRQISDAVEVAALAQIWGQEHALAARDLAIELGRNALTHGKATIFTFDAAGHTLTLSDNGEPFSLTDLSGSLDGKGGLTSLKVLRRDFPDLIVAYARTGEKNITTLASTNSLSEMLETNPCTIDFFGGMHSITAAMDFVETHPGCETIFLTPTYGGLCFSDLYNLKAGIERHGLQNRDIVLVLSPHSRGVLEFVADNLPNVRVIVRGG